ncbi:MAG: hypothetical protein IIB46_07025 [Nitrospinae bacterium]|nr:hypothetical protein [Nitrospinota bacterium]
MTKQLEDLFKSFTDMTIDEQFEKIAEVRDTRSIERPAVAKRRRKKESVVSEKKKDKVKQLLMNLSEDEREAMIRKLREGVE